MFENPDRAKVFETLKRYMRISNSNEDEVLIAIMESVEKSLTHYKIHDSIEMQNAPADLKACMMDHVYFLYENRGTDSTKIPDRILGVYKKYKNIRL